MSETLRELILFYILLAFSLGIMICSIKFFPYFTTIQKNEYFDLAIFALLLFLPFTFLVNVYRMAR